MDTKIYDVVALGELLIDFIECGTSEQKNTVFEANPGGAPCNVLAMLNRFGHRTAFIGKVGNDFFGNQLNMALSEAGIDDIGLKIDYEVHTTLAMVHKKEDGDREFSFYRNPGADMRLTKAEIPEELIRNCRIFHFGTISMTNESVREATVYAVNIAKKEKKIISFDPNLRLPLWQNMEILRECIIFGLKNCTILKIADNELVWLTGQEDYDTGIEWIQGEFNIPLILLSMGKRGSKAYWKNHVLCQKAYLRSDTIETTGAGDTFMGCILHFILEYGLEHLNEERIRSMLRFANAAASIITTRKGALRVMPTVEEVVTELVKN